MSITTTTPVNTLASKTTTTSKVGQPSVTLENLQTAFKTKCDPWMGVEVEWMIVNDQDGSPVDGYKAICNQLADSIQSQTRQEFLRSQIEFATTPSVASGHHRSQIAEFVRQATAAAEQVNACLLWSGSHPSWEFDRTLVSDCQRSQQNVARYGQRAMAFATCSMHCHVQVPHDMAIVIADAIQSYVPLLVALSSNSPYMSSQSPGVYSQRANIWAFQMINSGFPRLFGNWESFNQHIDRLLRSGRIQCQKDLYYFVRPTRFGTIEIRCCDLPLSIDGVIALATLSQALVVYLQDHPNERSAIDLLHCDLVDAIANGPHATLQTPYGKACNANDFLESLVNRLRPTARRLGSEAELERIPSVLSVNGSELQIAQKNGEGANAIAKAANHHLLYGER